MCWEVFCDTKINIPNIETHPIFLLFVKVHQVGCESNYSCPEQVGQLTSMYVSISENIYPGDMGFNQ
jgi:hypothetical protein